MVKVNKIRALGKKKIIKMWSRISIVILEFVGFTIVIYNGKKYVFVFITKNMVEHYFGEFISIRIFRAHNSQ